MSSSRLGSSAEARPVLPPRRNLAAGKRLAPLPPGLRSRLRGGPIATSASASTVTANNNGDTTQDLARTAPSVGHPSPPSSAQQPQRSSSKTRHASNPLANSASPRLSGGKDGRRYLPPVAQSNTAQSRSSASSLSSVSSPPASGRLSAPADAAHSRRASNDGPAVPSTTTTTTNLLVARTGPRASTSEGMRRPSPQRGREGLVRPPVASTRVAQPKPRAPGLPRTSGSSSVSTVAAAAPADGASARNGRVSAVVVTSKNSELDAVAEKETPAAVPKDVRASIAMPELPLAPHDMDAAFYTNTAQWTAAGDLPPLVHTLLEGTALEAPYTTSLWTQAYPKPAELLPIRATTTTQFVPINASFPSHDDSSNVLPLSFQHREAERRQGGFYACVRCATPVCSPSFQVVPAAAAMRGTAAFSRLNLDGVELRVKMPGLESRRRSLPASSIGASSHSSNAGGVELLVHCKHCGGCLGVMLIADVAVAAAVASRTTHQPALTYTQELLCANSACLRYLHYNTRAALDGELLGASSSSSSSSVRNGISGAAAFTAPQVGGGATMGAAFAPARRSAWGLPPSLQQQQLESSGGNGDGADAGDDDDDDSAESSLGDLLDALNPYSGGGGGSGGYDSD